MAKEKFRAGDEVRLLRNMSFGAETIRANSVGTITKYSDPFFGSAEIVVRFKGKNFDVTFTNTRYLAQAQVMDGFVGKE